MARNKRILYMIDGDTGQVWSQITGGNEQECIAVPMLDFGGMKPENKFEMNYSLEKHPISALYHIYSFIHTRKIPVEIKNQHRAFWGMKPIKK